MTSNKRDLVDSVISRMAAKIFLAFREPWWRKESLQYLNLTQGRTISSLPTRQTFYFTAPDPQASNNSFIMLYNDGQFSKFWRALATSTSKQFPTSPSAIYPMTDVLVAEVVRQLAINHNTTEDVIGRPYFAWMMGWYPDQPPRVVEGYGPFMPSQLTRDQSVKLIVSISFLCRRSVGALGSWIQLHGSDRGCDAAGRNSGHFPVWLCLLCTTRMG